MRQGKKEGERERKEERGRERRREGEKGRHGKKGRKEALSLSHPEFCIHFVHTKWRTDFLHRHLFLPSFRQSLSPLSLSCERGIKCEMSSVTSTPSTTGCVQSNNNQVQGNGLSSGMSSVGGGSPVSSQSGNNHSHHHSHNNVSSTPNNGGGNEQLSRTNLYIRGLPQTTTDKDLLQLCGQYGTIISTKAILDKNTNKCKGLFLSPLTCVFLSLLTCVFLSLLTCVFLSLLTCVFLSLLTCVFLSPFSFFFPFPPIRDMFSCFHHSLIS